MHMCRIKIIPRQLLLYIYVQDKNTSLTHLITHYVHAGVNEDITNTSLALFFCLGRALCKLADSSFFLGSTLTSSEEEGEMEGGEGVESSSMPASLHEHMAYNDTYVI